MSVLLLRLAGPLQSWGDSSRAELAANPPRVASSEWWLLRWAVVETIRWKTLSPCDSVREWTSQAQW